MHKSRLEIGRGKVALVALVSILSACGGGGGNSGAVNNPSAPPVITPACDDSGIFFVSDTFQYSTGQAQVGRNFRLTPSNPPNLCRAHYAAEGLPLGLSINANTGEISGQPTTAQSADVKVTFTVTGGTGAVTRRLTINVASYPAAPNGWVLLNALSPLPNPSYTYAARLGSAVVAMTPAHSWGSLDLMVAASADGGRTWRNVPSASVQSDHGVYDNPYSWFTPASDGQSVYAVSYETPTVTASEPNLYTRRYNGSVWTKKMAILTPPKRGGFSVMATNGELYMTGGQPRNWVYIPPDETNGWTYTNEVWRSVDQGLNWILVSSGSALPARAGHCSAVDSSGRLYVYGGHDQTQQRTDLWRSDDLGVSWTQVGNSGSFMTSSAHKAWIENCVIVGNRFYVVFDNASWRHFTGSHVGYFDLTTGTWTNDGLLPVAELSNAVQIHPGLVESGGKLLLIGGGTTGRDDVWSR